MASAKSTKSPAFQFYPMEFLGSSKVDVMSMTERGIYITLLSRCWDENGLPTDLHRLARYVRMKHEQFDRLWRGSPLHECFYERGGKLHNPRLDKERQKQAEYKRRQTDNGAKGGRPKGKPKEPVGYSGETQPKPKKTSSSLSSSLSPSLTKKERASTEQKPHTIKAFLTVYESLFSELAGTKPAITSRDAKIAKDTIEHHGEPKAYELLRAFFASSDPFIQKSGYGLNVFSGQINKLLMGERQSGVTLTTSKTAGNLDVMRRFIERGKSA